MRKLLSLGTILVVVLALMLAGLLAGVTVPIVVAFGALAVLVTSVLVLRSITHAPDFLATVFHKTRRMFHGAALLLFLISGDRKMMTTFAVVHTRDRPSWLRRLLNSVATAVGVAVLAIALSMWAVGTISLALTVVLLVAAFTCALIAASITTSSAMGTTQRHGLALVLATVWTALLTPARLLFMIVVAACSLATAALKVGLALGVSFFAFTRTNDLTTDITSSTPQHRVRTTTAITPARRTVTRMGMSPA